MINKIPKVDFLGIFKTPNLTFEKFNELIDYQKPITLENQTVLRWNLRKGYNAKITLTADRTIILDQLTSGDYGTLEVIQGGSGSYTLGLPTGSKVSGGGNGMVTLSTSVGSIDILSFYYNGTYLYWNISTDFS